MRHEIETSHMSLQVEEPLVQMMPHTPLPPSTPLQLSHMLPPTPHAIPQEETEQVVMPPPPTPSTMGYSNLQPPPSVGYPTSSTPTPMGYPGTPGPPSVGYPGSVGPPTSMMYPGSSVQTLQQPMGYHPAPTPPPPQTSQMGYPGTPAPATPLSHIEDMPHLPPDQVYFYINC